MHYSANAQLTTLGLWVFSQGALACIGSFHLPPVRSIPTGNHGIQRRDNEGYTGCVISTPLTCNALGTCPYESRSDSATGPWTPAQNLRQMQVSDDAYVSRDLAKFNHRDDTIVYMPGGHEYDMAQHVADMMNTFASFPDVRPHNHPYKIQFGEGNWTFALTDVTGTNTGPIQGPSGWVGPTGRGFNIEMATLGYWEDGKIVIEYIWADGMKQTRQLGFLPSPLPNTPTIGLTLSNHSTPLSTTGQNDPQQNKKLYDSFETAFNKGSINAKSLKFSPDIKVYGVDLDGEVLGLDQYLDLIKQNRKSFPDLKLASIQTLGSGDWTAAVSTLTGTLNGEFEVPDYLSSTPIQANGKKISVRQFTIARWQNGLITHVKILSDPLTILAQVQ